MGTILHSPGRVGSAAARLGYLLAGGLLLLGGAGCPKKVEPRVAWGAQPSSAVDYRIERKKALRDEGFSETDTLQLRLAFGSAKDLTVTLDQQPATTVTAGADGRYLPGDAAVPLVAQLLLLAVPPQANPVKVGDAWTVRSPEDGALRGDRLEMQVEHEVKVTAVRDDGDEPIVELAVTGRKRFVDNAFAMRLLGLSGPGDSPAHQAYTGLTGWNYYLDGQLAWNAAAGLPERADFVIVAGPAVLTAAGEVRTARTRNELTFTRVR